MAIYRVSVRPVPVAATRAPGGPLRPDRREFLHLVARGAMAGWLGAGALGCGGSSSVSPVLDGGADDCCPGDAATGIELVEATIADLQQAMQAGRATARSIIEQYLARIAAVNTTGAELRAILEVNGEALKIADDLDGERRMGKVRGPLHGIPLLLKGNVATADAMGSTAGSLALVGLQAKADATLVKKLRAAGAIVLAKTNLSEWANFRSTRSINGWSGEGGQCRNPYALDRDPCGSSSGTGAGVSANLGAAGIGTETDGSITCPSSASGLVGLKPTVGLVSRRGIIPISASQDTAGPMTRTVRDAAILLGAIAGIDPDDPATAGAQVMSDYTAVLDTDGMRGAKIGVLSPGNVAAATGALAGFMGTAQMLGASVTSARLAGNTWGGSENTVLQYEFKAGLAQYLAEFAPDATVKNLADLIAFNEAHRDEEMSLFGQEIFLQAQQRGSLADQAYRDARTRCIQLARTQCLDAAFAMYGVDAFAFVTLPPPCVLGQWHGGFVGHISAAAVAGYPHITVPGGLEGDLPVGISFVGRQWSEGLLLRLAYAFEQATHHRRAPKLLETASYEGC